MNDFLNSFSELIKDALFLVSSVGLAIFSLYSILITIRYSKKAANDTTRRKTRSSLNSVTRGVGTSPETNSASRGSLWSFFAGVATFFTTRCSF